MANMYKSIMLIKFNEAFTEQDFRALATHFVELKRVLMGIMSLSYGAIDDEKSAANGFTHAVVMDFVDDAYLQDYLAHPLYDKALQHIQPHLATDDGLQVMHYPLVD